ncbi:MAG: hypothetical protein JWM98_2337, partial [Thermoleophilia bacterium]|nr:hypothetical protein [Thermoleophilia bacterium]
MRRGRVASALAVSTLYHSVAGAERPLPMQLLPTAITTLLAGILVVLVPGACILALTRLERVVHPPLVPAAALSLGLLPLGAATGATLALHQPIEAVLAILAVFVLASWAALARRERAAHGVDARRGDARP